MCYLNRSYRVLPTAILRKLPLRRAGSSIAGMDEETAPKRGLARNTANYGDRDFALYLRRSFAKSMGYSQAMLDRPVVGIVEVNRTPAPSPQPDPSGAS